MFSEANIHLCPGHTERLSLPPLTQSCSREVRSRNFDFTFFSIGLCYEQLDFICCLFFFLGGGGGREGGRGWIL